MPNRRFCPGKCVRAHAFYPCLILMIIILMETLMVIPTQTYAHAYAHVYPNGSCLSYAHTQTYNSLTCVYVLILLLTGTHLCVCLHPHVYTLAHIYAPCLRRPCLLAMSIPHIYAHAYNIHTYTPWLQLMSIPHGHNSCLYPIPPRCYSTPMRIPLHPGLCAHIYTTHAYLHTMSMPSSLVLYLYTYPVSILIGHPALWVFGRRGE